MKTKNTAAAALVMLLATLVVGWGPARAEEEKGSLLDSENFSATFTLATDYVFRGISQTDEKPAVQGSIDYGHPIGIYLGIWGSNVHSDISKGGVELDYYIGYARELCSNFNLDLTFFYYSYPGGGSDPEPDYLEGHIGLDYTFATLPLSPKIGSNYYYSPDFFGEDGDAHYVNGIIELSLPYELTLAGELGYQDVEGDKLTGDGQGENGKDGFDYYHWRVGISREILKFVLDLSYQDTNETSFLGGDIADARVVFSVSRTF
ncbi:MAG: hypothetical protein JSW39_28125 [Desulfobacterales bacterium]|nr:MAG: hypothetical protein JSW39_28125 [Desulfobacterales bacterium]